MDYSGVPDEERYESLRHAYTEAALSFRHYSALRFAILSVYVALVGALGGVALGVIGGGAPNVWVIRISAFAAIVVTWTFLTCEIVCERNRHYFAGVMQDLEAFLPCKTMTRFPTSSLFQASRAFRVLYSFNLILWLWVLARGHL
ncbi:MAG: hypothetical protein M3P06_06250 [Acidobacteriota bacterium]|nr:hypothetical protein [Acidobacteriota bacterium]